MSLCWRRRFIPQLEWWKANSGMHKSGAGGRTDCFAAKPARLAAKSESLSHTSDHPLPYAYCPKCKPLSRQPVRHHHSIPPLPPLLLPAAADVVSSGRTLHTAAPLPRRPLQQCHFTQGSASAHCVALPPPRYGQSLRATVLESFPFFLPLHSIPISAPPPLYEHIPPS